MRDGRVLDNRTCLIAALHDWERYTEHCVGDEEWTSSFRYYVEEDEPPRNGEVFVRLGFLLSDRADTVLLPDGRRLNGLQCLAEAERDIFWFRCDNYLGKARLILGHRLGEDEAVQFADSGEKVYTKKSCYYESADYTVTYATEVWDNNYASDHVVFANATFHLGLVFLREAHNGAEMVDPKVRERDESTAVDYFAQSLGALESSVVYFTLGVVLHDGKTTCINNRLVDRRTCFASAIVTEEVNLLWFVAGPHGSAPPSIH